MSSQETKKNIYNHLIMLLDESGSMESMGSEPKQAVLTFVKNFKNENTDARLTFATFNDKLTTHLDNSSIEEGELDFHYNPTGCTALFDAITTTINNTLESKEPNTKIMVIITDGQENSSSKYFSNKKDLKKLVTKVETENEWKVIFLGVNIDGFSDAHDMNINLNRISEFDQTHKGSLLELCRTASDAANTFTRSRTNGDTDADLILPSPPKLTKTKMPDPDSDDLPPLVFLPLRRELTSNILEDTKSMFLKSNLSKLNCNNYW